MTVFTSNIRKKRITTMINVIPEDKKSKVKVLIVGRTATGKDYLANELKSRGMTLLKSHTTRPKRSDDEDTHTFITNEEYDAINKSTIAAYTEINGNKYFATKDDVLNCDVYIIDVNGLRRISESMPDTPVIVVYMTANEEERKKRFIKRSGLDENKALKEYEERTESENAQFSEFEKILADNELSKIGNNLTVITVRNNFLPSVIVEVADFITNSIRQHSEIIGLVDKASDMGLFNKDADGRIEVKISNKDEVITTHESPDVFALKILNDHDVIGRLVSDMLILGFSFNL